jgi:NTE family protein
VFNPLKYFRKHKVGLALGSGGSKGIAHIAVIEHLQSMGIPIDMIAGSSIGAIVGALHCCGSLERFKEDLLNAKVREMISLVDLVFPRSGFIQGNDFVEFMKKYIPADARIEDLDTPLCIVATDYNDGKAVLFQSGNVLQAMRASMSIPGVFIPLKSGETYLIDGGVANPLPVNIVKKMGANLTIAVNLPPTLKHRFRSPLKEAATKGHKDIDPATVQIMNADHNLEKSSKENGRSWLETFHGWLKREKKKDEKEEYPGIFEVITQSIDIMEYVNTTLMLKYNSPTVLIEPAVLDFKTLDFTKAEEIMKRGEEACQKANYALKTKVKLWV